MFPVEGTGKDRTQRVIIHYRFVGTLDTPGTDEPKDDEGGLGTGAIVAIVVGSVLVVGVGGFALVWFVIKKKTWAEFLAIFKKG